jgi:hypothetical protein
LTLGPTYRERAARSMAVALVVWATYRIVLVTALLLSGFASTGDPAVAPLIERYSALSGRVPATGVVGYVGPTEPEPRHQMLARYALAPLPLATNDAYDRVLVDLDNDTALAEYAARAKARILVHPRPGLAIVERERRTP